MFICQLFSSLLMAIPVVSCFHFLLSGPGSNLRKIIYELDIIKRLTLEIRLMQKNSNGFGRIGL